VWNEKEFRAGLVEKNAQQCFDPITLPLMAVWMAESMYDESVKYDPSQTAVLIPIFGFQLLAT